MIHSFVIFCNDAALGPIGYFEYPRVCVAIGRSLAMPYRIWRFGWLMGLIGVEVSLDSQGSTWSVSDGFAPKEFQSCKVAIFANTVQTRPETGRFSSSLLQDWLAPSRLVLAPDPLRLSGAFAAAKAAAQLATAKVGVHLHSLWI